MRQTRLRQEHLEYVKKHFVYRDGDLFRVKLKDREVEPYLPYSLSPGNEYLKITVGKKMVTVLHKAIWALHNNKWPDFEIDHINRDKLDNRIENLRELTTTDNNYNTKKYKNNTTGIKNLDYHEGYWRIRISLNGKTMYRQCKDKKKAIKLCKIYNWLHKPTRYNREVDFGS